MNKIPPPPSVTLEPQDRPLSTSEVEFRRREFAQLRSIGESLPRMGHSDCAITMTLETGAFLGRRN